jgi:hypothetical protein
MRVGNFSAVSAIPSAAALIPLVGVYYGNGYHVHNLAYAAA